MSISSNDSILNTPSYDGGPGWVWGGGDAGWVYQGSYDQASEQQSSSLAQTLLAGLQQQQSPPQQDWFAQANSMAMAAMVAAQTSSASATPAQVLTGHDAGLGALGLDAVAYSPSEAYTPPPAAQNIFNASPAEGWVWGGGDAGWNYQPSNNDLLSTAITAAWNHEQQTAAHVASIAAAGSTLGALANGLLMNQAANGSTHSPSDKSLGTIKTGANPPVTAGAARTQSTATNNSNANSNAGTPNTLTRADTPPRPQARTGELWEGGQGVATLWSQYQADPYRLMQTMAEYGVSAQEIAQASGQSLDDITVYLSRAGAPVGFAGANIIDRDAVDRAFLAALDQASQASTPPGMGSTFDVQAFSSWYAAQDTQASREFARLHGANFSQSQAIAVAGQWQGGGDSGVWTWQGGQLARQGQTASSQSQIANYLSYSQASAQELQSVDFMLGDQINQDLLAHFGSDIPLPNSEYVERMRARYGSQRAEQMYRIMQASGAVRQAYADAVNAQQIQQPWPEEIQSQSTAPGLQLNHQETQYTSASQPWWSVTHHVEHDNTFSTVNFNLQAYTDWYAAQDTPASRLFEQLYGSQLTTVEHRENRGEGDIHEWSNTYIGAGGASEILLGNFQASGDQGERWEQAQATDYGISASCVAMDGDMKLFDAGAITFDPVMGFVTAHDNINNSDWTDMILPVFVGAVAGAFLGPLAAQGVGFTAGTTAGSIAAVGFGGAIGSAFSGLMATGSIDFEQVLKSALTAVLTAGFAELTGIQDAGLLTDARGNVVLINGVQVVTDWGTRIASMGVQAAFSGIVSDLMGGDFSQGFVQSVASQLGREIMNAVHGEIRNSSTPLTAHEQATYNLMGRGLSAALTIAANPDNPMQALALGFISEIGAGLGNAVGSVNTRPTNWADTPVNGLTEDDGWTVVGGGNGGTNGGGNTGTAIDTNANASSGADNSASQYHHINGIPLGPNLRWNDDGWQPVEAEGGGLHEGLVASAGNTTTGGTPEVAASTANAASNSNEISTELQRLLNRAPAPLDVANFSEAASELQRVLGRFPVPGAARPSIDVGDSSIKWSFRNSEIAYQNASYRLFGETFMPQLAAIMQGPGMAGAPSGVGLGDCFLLSALGAIAVSDPSQLLSMISEQADGRYSVTFNWNGTAIVVGNVGDATAAFVSPTGGGAFGVAPTQTNGSWVTVLENAYIALLEQQTPGHGAARNFAGGMPSSPIELVGQVPNVKLYVADSTSSTISAFNWVGTTMPAQPYDHSASSVSPFLPTPAPYGATSLHADFLQGARIVASSPPGHDPLNGVVGQHAYFVTNVTADVHGNVTSIALANPWGKPGMIEGDLYPAQLTLTPAQFFRFFSSVAVGKL